MSPKKINWGRFRLEFSDDRFRLQIAGGPISDGLGFSLLGIGVWCVFCIPMIAVGANISPWVYVGMALIPVLFFGLGMAMGSNAENSGFVAMRHPTPGLSLMQFDGVRVLPAEDIREFVTRQREMQISGGSHTVWSLVAVTRRGEFAVIPEMLTNKKGADVFGRVLSALLLGHGSFEVAVRQALEVRRRDLRLFAIFAGVFALILMAGLMFFFKHI